MIAIHKDYKKTRSENGLQGIALEFGAYIVRVTEQHFGPAEWERDDASLGKDTFPLRWRGTTIFPVGWRLKRIVNGPGDTPRERSQLLLSGKQQLAASVGRSTRVESSTRVTKLVDIAHLVETCGRKSTPNSHRGSFLE